MKDSVRKKLVYVAMSGGVDSSVAAALLAKQGFNLVGVFMRPWSPDFQQTTNNKQQGKLSVVGSQSSVNCMWENEREDAMRAASAIGIPLLTWDFSGEYERKVTRYMINGYKRGVTPNPDVMCNKEIKFGLFLKKALKAGADFVATGHYARIQKCRMKNEKWRIKNPTSVRHSSFVIRHCLTKAKDPNKDQTYFLWTLTQEQLAKTIFPVGEYLKPEVRRLAKKFGLANHDKRDSQGVCFVGPLNMKQFLKKYIKPKPGKILHADGRVVGLHDGAAYYTIGQRHGLDITDGGGPYYVLSKNMLKNTVTVGPVESLASRTASVSDIQLADPKMKLPLRVKVKVRYRSPSASATLMRGGRLVFKKPQRAVTAGQSAVFYIGQRVIGGGIIC